MLSEIQIDSKILSEHGISDSEYDAIKEILNREPNYVELGIFSVMWSEHCSYKSSIKMLKTLPTEGNMLLVEAGEENAGLVKLENNLALAFKIESHNHPSAVEPYEGAATGVGGIMRDIFTMGARPIASLNSLRFGSLKIPRNKFLLDEVVKGIGDYGNCLGIPTIGGEVYIEDCYSDNCLVNAMSLGVVKTENITSAIAKTKGSPVFIVGASTGRDGIHGATFASEELTAETESKRSNVQVGDPFTEKLLLEASLELSQKKWLIGMQDMGAAGITCSCSEMSAKGKSGIKIDLDKVPLREKNMNAYEIMLSESQERMLVVIKKGYEENLEQIFRKWDLNCVQIGEVTDSGMLEVFHNNELVANIPSESLVLGGGAPQYEMNAVKPKYIDQSNQFNIDTLNISKADYNRCLITLLLDPNLSSKQFIYQQYDSTVRTNTVEGPGGDAAIIRLKGTKKGIAVSTDCNSKYVYLDPFMGGIIAVAESARNVVCSGAKPIAITNCLNFGNPTDPEIYWQFKEAVLGIGMMCRALNTPVTGGNVSFYNESKSNAVFPTPVIGMIGIIDDISNTTNISFKNNNDYIIMMGVFNPQIGGSEYLKIIHNTIEGPISPCNIENEVGVQNLCLDLTQNKLINSAHDLSEGGLAINLVESLVNSYSGLGATIQISEKLKDIQLLFGESQSTIIATVNEKNLVHVLSLSKQYEVPIRTIGRVNNQNKLIINNLINIDRQELEDVFFNSLEKMI